MEKNAAIRLFQPVKHLRGAIALERSKSLSNRALIIRALSGNGFPLTHLSASSDTTTLERLLDQLRDTGPSRDAMLDAGAGGTTFRFLTAFLAFQPGTQFLMGNERMRERPVGPLVDALRQLGARIDYTGEEGFPPLRIGPPEQQGRAEVAIPASVSSQFVSALLMVGPSLPQGLRLTLEGTVVSQPYISMTLALMRHFGVDAHLAGNEISVPAGVYQPRPFDVESDWSAASYYYALAALSESCDFFLEGLQEHSLQGDSVLVKKMKAWGVDTTFEENGARLTKVKDAAPPPFIEWDFLPNPDLAQTISVLCAATGTHGLFSGLETLRVKETDRVTALQEELIKVGVWLTALPARMAQRSGKAYFQQDGFARWDGTPRFATYGDHRMAMALSILGCLGPVCLENPGVVEKSYPGYWNDLSSLGFVIEPVS